MRSKRSTLPLAQQHSKPLLHEPTMTEEQWDEQLEADEDNIERAEEEDERREVDERGHPSAPMVLINPVITAVSPHSGMRQEACLSIPGYNLAQHPAFTMTHCIASSLPIHSLPCHCVSLVS